MNDAAVFFRSAATLTEMLSEPLLHLGLIVSPCRVNAMMWSVLSPTVGYQPGLFLDLADA